VGRWAEAFAQFSEADKAGNLDADDLDLLASAALFTGRPEASVDARQRAYAAFLGNRDSARAGLAALSLALSHLGRGAVAVGAGWLELAERHLGTDENCAEHAWLVWAHAVFAAEGGTDLERSLADADDTISTGQRLGCLDVEALGLLLKGQLLVRRGDVTQGCALLDQVMALAVGGCLGPFASAWSYCGTVTTCATAGEYERAWQWSSEVGRCAAGPGSSDFPGDCRLHRAELLRLRGNWTEAEFEVARVCDQLASWHVGHAAMAYYELGELSLCKGDLEAAEEAFDRARDLGKDPQPGLTALLLRRGHTERAAVAIRDALYAREADPANRALLLPVAVEAALAIGEPEWARRCVEELEQLAAAFSSPAHRARATHAAGTYALAAGDHARARTQLTHAVSCWVHVGAPYDAAKARLELAAAHLAAQDPAAHASQLEQALHDFERLGATLDARRAAELLGRAPGTSRVARALMFTDIEDSTSLLAELGDDAWSDLLRWHDTTLRRLFGRHHGQEIHQKGGGDGFFVVFNTPQAGLDCAIAIQQSLRTDDERPIAVRIGVHWAEVLHAQGDFSGRGVHEAARVAALAVGGEILTTTTTLRAAAANYPIASTRRAELRGLPGHVEVAAIDWSA